MFQDDRIWLFKDLQTVTCLQLGCRMTHYQEKNSKPVQLLLMHHVQPLDSILTHTSQPAKAQMTMAAESVGAHT